MPNPMRMDPIITPFLLRANGESERGKELLSEATWFQYKANALQDFSYPERTERTNLFLQLMLIYRKYLRHVDDALLRQIGFSRLQQDISRGLRPLQVGCQCADNDRIDMAAI